MKDFTKELEGHKGIYRGLLEMAIYELEELENEYEREFDLSWEELVDVVDYACECADRYYPDTRPTDHIRSRLEYVLDVESLEEEEEE